MPDGIIQGLDSLQTVFGALPSYLDGVVVDVVQGLSEVVLLNSMCHATDSLGPLQIHPIAKVAVVALSVPYKVNHHRR